MKKKKVLIALSMIAISGISLTSCGKTNITGMDFTVAEPTLKEEVDAFDSEDYTYLYQYISVLQLASYGDSDRIPEDFVSYVEKVEKVRNSIFKDYESITQTAHTVDKKTNRITDEKAVIDLKTLNVFYSMNSYFEKDGKKENYINIVSKAYKKDDEYTVLSDVSLNEVKYTTKKVDKKTGLYIKVEVSGNKKLYTTYKTKRDLGDDEVSSFKHQLIDSATSVPMSIVAQHSAKAVISKDMSYSYFEYTSENSTQKSLIENYIVKSSSYEHSNYYSIHNYSLNKEKAFSDDESPKLDGYEKYDYEEKYTYLMPLCATPLMAGFEDSFSSSYSLILENETLLNKFQVKEL